MTLRDSTLISQTTITCIHFVLYTNVVKKRYITTDIRSYQAISNKPISIFRILCAIADSYYHQPAQFHFEQREKISKTVNFLSSGAPKYKDERKTQQQHICLPSFLRICLRYSKNWHIKYMNPCLHH